MGGLNPADLASQRRLRRYAEDDGGELETKARRVRTPEGARRYKVPIGAPIPPGDKGKGGEAGHAERLAESVAGSGGPHREGDRVVVHPGNAGGPRSYGTVTEAVDTAGDPEAERHYMVHVDGRAYDDVEQMPEHRLARASAPISASQQHEAMMAELGWSPSTIPSDRGYGVPAMLEDNEFGGVDHHAPGGVVRTAREDNGRAIHTFDRSGALEHTARFSENAPGYDEALRATLKAHGATMPGEGEQHPGGAPTAPGNPSSPGGVRVLGNPTVRPLPEVGIPGYNAPARPDPVAPLLEGDAKAFTQAVQERLNEAGLVRESGYTGGENTGWTDSMGSTGFSVANVGDGRLNVHVVVSGKRAGVPYRDVPGGGPDGDAGHEPASPAAVRRVSERIGKALQGMGLEVHHVQGTGHQGYWDDDLDFDAVVTDPRGVTPRTGQFEIRPLRPMETAWLPPGRKSEPPPFPDGRLSPADVASQGRLRRWQHTDGPGVDAKAERHVRTAEGAKKYKLPIGAPIARALEGVEHMKPGHGLGHAHLGDAAGDGLEPPPSKLKGEVFHPKDVDEAVRLLHDGKRVEFEQPDQLSTLLDKLNGIVQDALSKGEKPPVYDLCKVSVKGTNLFCVESKGVPRIRMPQLSGKPIAGSRADKLPKNAKGEVDLTGQFRDALEARGVKIDDDTVAASHLRASQMELNGGKVAGMTRALEAGKLPPGRIFVSRDNYVVDGHHRWAANVAADYEKDQHLGDDTMDVARIDLPIIQLLALSNNFSHSWGIPSAVV